MSRSKLRRSISLALLPVTLCTLLISGTTAWSVEEDNPLLWSQEFNEDQKLFDQRYKPSGLQYMPDYPKRYSLTGEFIEDGPFASNAPIPTN